MGKRIGFFADGLPFDGDTIHHRSLGGSESAVYYMARELRLLGYEVWVVNNCDQPGTYEGVRYVHKRDFGSLALRTEFDVFIVSRFYNFFQVPFRSRLNILWNHDMLDNKFALMKYLPRIQVLFNLSHFHTESYLMKIPELKIMIRQTRNGIDPAAVNGAALGSKKIHGKMIYASRPERGLKVLLESIWPMLKSIFPEIELYICGYAFDEQSLPSKLRNLYSYLDGLMKESPGVYPLGRLSKKEYYLHLSEAQLMLYPCDFPEISCIVALEAQACKTPIVTTKGFALRETVGVEDWLVDGLPGSKEYLDGFIGKVQALLTDHSLYEESAERGYQWVMPRFTWPTIAREWSAIFEEYRSGSGKNHEV
jgi:glycosyltransferase involved in cell wall biosynthesis